MSEPTLISPLLDGFLMGGAISEHDGVRCYPAMRKDSDEKYIVKVISIPASPVKMDALLLTGAYRDRESALGYFRELADGAAGEAEILQKLSRLDGFTAYEGWQIVPMENGGGFDVYLLGRYRTTLEKQFRRHPLTHLGAVNLGLDLCSALTACRRVGYLYADLKPQNVTVSEDGTYHISDLGLFALDSLAYASLPDRYRSAYTPPEIQDAFSSLNTTVDTYAVGLILYQAYNNGELPTENRAAPAYADYEMSEIILKACDPNPDNRWPDPSQMGQALVNYMQRNGANDTPIVPPPAEPEPAEEAPAPEEAAPAEDTAAPETEISEQTPEDAGDLSFIDEMVSDETAPDDETAAALEDAALTVETSEILAQADELIAHETPEPAVAPEAIDVPMPEPIVLPPEEEDVEIPGPAPDEEEAPAEEAETAGEEAPAAPTPADETEDAPEEEDPADEEEAPPAKPKKKGWVGWVLALVIVAGLAFGGQYFYRHYYLQYITDLTLEGAEDKLTAHLTTDIPESELLAVCTDTYGIAQTAVVKDGTAVFTGLNPATSYTVTFKMTGFHKLAGNISASYTTAKKTEIVSFTAVTGASDGCVILSFTADGPSPDQWTLSYQAEGEEAKTTTFTGHSVTLPDLTVGKTYTFRLVPTDGMYLTGTEEITYTASKLLTAENARFTALNGNDVTLAWDTPADAGDISWTVNEYDADGTLTANYPQSVSPLTVTLESLDSAHTFEILASGMTQGVQLPLSANPAQLDSFLPDTSNPPRFYLQWGYSGSAPTGGWNVTVTADGSAPLNTLSCPDSNLELDTLIPGAHYVFTITAADGSTVFGGVYEYDAPAAQPFEGYWVTADLFDFRMCRTPEDTDWDRYTLSEDDYTTAFAAGEKASFLVYVNGSYDTSDDTVVTFFVIRNSAGVPVLVSSQSRTWTQMWYQRYCSLDIPELPTEPGQYTIDIYFNGMAAGTVNFQIQ